MERTKDIWVSVMKVRSDNPKAPIMNVFVNFPDGTVLEGGVWEKTSKNGNVYLSGKLKRKEEGAERPSRREERESSRPVKVDW